MSDRSEAKETMKSSVKKTRDDGNDDNTSVPNPRDTVTFQLPSEQRGHAVVSKQRSLAGVLSHHQNNKSGSSNTMNSSGSDLLGLKFADGDLENNNHHEDKNYKSESSRTMNSSGSDRLLV